MTIEQAKKTAEAAARYIERNDMEGLDRLQRAFSPYEWSQVGEYIFDYLGPPVETAKGT